ncbi:MAG: hypothetical protein O7C75_04370, partial [Verrucomicrobia bacterium]|nr:hypothetical protein [Verrucomicrobiota bacterium]
MQAEVHFISGYRLDDIVSTYPDIHISVNPNWESQGSLGSLLAAPLNPGQTTYVCYADIVISSDSVRLLSQADGDVNLLADRSWRHRYEGRSDTDLASAEKLCIADNLVVEIGSDIPVEKADGEFVGLVKLSPAAVDHLLEIAESKRQTLGSFGIPRLIQEFQDAGFKVRPIEIEGGWAELNAPQDLARFALGTKADTLERLRPLVRHSCIGEQVTFTVDQWQTDG